MENFGNQQYNSPETISRVINLCDNLFYNNYLETGVLNSREEICGRIKQQVAETFVDFWGPAHSQKIQDKVNSTEIAFLYQTIGPRNSIDEFLKQVKLDNFNKTTGGNFEFPISFEYVSWLLSQNGNDLKAVLETSSSPNIDFALSQLGVTKEEILVNENLARLTANQINELAAVWDKTGYSSNPEINENLQFLDGFVSQHRMNMIKQNEEECRLMGIAESAAISEQFYQAMFVNYWGVRKDPIAKITAPDYSDWDLFRNDNLTEAYHCNGMVAFGINPSDLVLIHEFVHSVDSSGFEKGHREKGGTPYSSQYRENQMFNEVITDYFAVQMFNARNARGKGNIINGKGFTSSYSQLFEIMDGFLSAYMPELKETRLREFPAEEFMRVVGESQFENIAILCNEVMGLNHNRTILDIAELSGAKGQELEALLEGLTKEQSPIRQVVNFLGRNSAELATKLQSKDSPHLQKFAQLLFGASNTIGALTQQHVAKTLEPPIESLSKESENDMEMVMEKNNNFNY